jgi:hypothetical protein
LVPVPYLQTRKAERKPAPAPATGHTASLQPVPRSAFAAAGLATLLLLAVSWQYGYHRDELYFLEAGPHHLAWGYVDQPPLTPALAAFGNWLLGASPTAIRVVPALVMGLTVILTALCARELGGGRVAQTIAAVAGATVPEWLGGGHLLSTTPLDTLAWGALLYVVIRIIRRDEDRLWLAAGAIAGVGLLNKWNLAFLAVALALGLLFSSERGRLRSPYLWAGIAIAALIWLPNLIWQAQNDWPSLTMLRHLHHENVDDGNQAAFIPAQVLYVGFAVLPIWVAGLVHLARNPATRPYRGIAIAYGLLVAWSLASAGKPYYISGMYVALIGAGAVATEGWLQRRAGRFPSYRALLVAILILAVPTVVLALPVLPARTLHDTNLQDINYDLGEQIAWPRMVDQIADAYRSLPAGERRRAVLFTSNYGEAGAIDRYGPALGLPTAYSGHNSYWYWGPPPGRRSPAVVAVGLPRSYLLRYFAHVDLVGRLSNGLGVSDDEQHAPLVICHGQRARWPALWPQLRHFN